MVPRSVALSCAKFGCQALALVFFEVPVPIVTFRVGASGLALLERFLDFANAQCASLGRTGTHGRTMRIGNTRIVSLGRCSIACQFKFKRDAKLAEHSTDLRPKAKTVHGGGGDRHEQTDLAALEANRV